LIKKAEAMLNISDAQFSAIDDDARLRFRIRLAAWLRVHAEPARNMDDQELIALIERQEPRAAAYQIETERGIAKWCYLALMTAERFDQMPEIDAFLKEERNGTPPQRLDKLIDGYTYAAQEHELGIRK
jgi:hypothetical protein